MRVLLVEDDPLIGTAIQQAMRGDAYSVDWVRDGEAGLSAVRAQEYNLLLLDLGLPRKSGIEILKQIRDERIRLPVIITTARDAIDDRIQGLDMGADDYLIKPFSIDELKARSRAVIRRNQGVASSTLQTGNLILDKATGELSQGKKQHSLSARELSLMRILMLRPGQVFSKSELEEQIYGWGEEVASNAVEVIIHGLRKKIGRTTIKNIRGLGWMVNK